jgi:3D (Asp-Asp-Asp) domain-containing protein
VKLNVRADSSERADAEPSAEADEYGNILNKEFSPTDADLGASFTLTATGQTSGRTASARFTDGGNVVYGPSGVALSAVDGSNNPYNGAAFVNTSKVTITLSASDNSGGSGVAVTRYKVDNGPFKNYTGPFDINNEGLSVVTYFSVDNTGAQETAQFFFVKLDRTAPAVNCGTADGLWHNADVNVACTAAGVSTSSVGPYTFTVTATDRAGNTASKSVTYGVVYDWSGFLQPINADGTSVFKLGSTVPVKFRLVGGSASVVNVTNFTLWVAKVSNNVVGSEVEASTSTAASTGNLFRYDPSGGIYIYNLGTKGAPLDCRHLPTPPRPRRRRPAPHRAHLPQTLTNPRGVLSTPHS